MFSGKNSEQYNALMTALWKASEDQEIDVYEFLDSPKTSLIVNLVDALMECGYKIIKN